MDKEIILDLINALKTLKDICLRQGQLMAEHFDFHFKAEESNINYYSKRLIKINKDINELMKINLEQKKFELYLENSNKEFKQIAEELKQFNNKHKVESEDFKLSYKDLYDKLNEFDFILNGIKDTLE